MLLPTEAMQARSAKKSKRARIVNMGPLDDVFGRQYKLTDTSLGSSSATGSGLLREGDDAACNGLATSTDTDQTLSGMG